MSVFETCVGYWDWNNTYNPIIGTTTVISGASLTSDRFGITNHAYSLTSGNTITWESITFTGKACWENIGSGWVFNSSPSYISSTGISGFVGTLGEVFLFSTAIPSNLDIITSKKYIYPYQRGERRYE